MNYLNKYNTNLLALGFSTKTYRNITSLPGIEMTTILSLFLLHSKLHVPIARTSTC